MPSVSDWKVPASVQPKPEDYAYDLEAALSAVVGIRAIIPGDAFTAETLGTERAGNGVLIDDGLVLIPGEDLFYYTSGRRPRFPVIMFDHTVNPFAPEEIRRIAFARNIRWLIVKNDLQVNGEPVEDKARLLALLLQDFHLVQNLGIYDVYRREK